MPLYLLRETNSSSLFGAVTACSFIPLVVFSFLGGVLLSCLGLISILFLSIVCFIISVMASIIAISSCLQPIGQALYGILFEKLYTMPWTVMVGGVLVQFCIR